MLNIHMEKGYLKRDLTESQKENLIYYREKQLKEVAEPPKEEKKKKNVIYFYNCIFHFINKVFNFRLNQYFDKIIK